jgi:hypothetical protein
MTGYQRGPKDRFVTNQQQTGQLHVGGGGSSSDGSGGPGSGGAGGILAPLAAMGILIYSRARGWA